MLIHGGTYGQDASPSSTARCSYQGSGHCPTTVQPSSRRISRARPSPSGRHRGSQAAGHAARDEGHLIPLGERRAQREAPAKGRPARCRSRARASCCLIPHSLSCAARDPLLAVGHASHCGVTFARMRRDPCPPLRPPIGPLRRQRAARNRTRPSTIRATRPADGRVSVDPWHRARRVSLGITLRVDTPPLADWPSAGGCRGRRGRVRTQRVEARDTPSRGSRTCCGLCDDSVRSFLAHTVCSRAPASQT